MHAQGAGPKRYGHAARYRSVLMAEDERTLALRQRLQEEHMSSQALDKAVSEWARKGAVLQSRTETQAQMVIAARPRSLWLLLVLLVLGVVPGLLYLVWPRKSTIVTLTVGDDGNVRTVTCKR